MAFGNWDEVIEEYEQVYLNSRYAEHAKRILELIPSIRGDDSFKSVLPGISLGNLTLGIEGKETRIYVWFEETDQQYRVYFLDVGGQVTQMTTVQENKLLSTLREYIAEVRNSSSA